MSTNIKNSKAEQKLIKLSSTILILLPASLIARVFATFCEPNYIGGGGGKDELM